LFNVDLKLSYFYLFTQMKYTAVVIGVSAGGMNALGKILPALPQDFPLPVIIVQHVSPSSDNYMVRHFNSHSQVTVKEADEKEQISPGVVYFAPPNYHLLIEEDRTFSLSTEGRVNYSRPSVDVLFESALDAYCSGLIGIILTGANNDGSKGLKKIKDCGGLAIVQDPATAEVPAMPEAALKLTRPDHILKLEDIAPMLIKLARK
jgi:two-component system, chemotaxis family, protein-glutamate methylesterase/glutaminase